MNTDLMFSKQSDEWTTPSDLFDQLQQEFRFDWDAAATQANALCDAGRYFGLDHADAYLRDALAVQQWFSPGQRERFFLNPPYSKCRAFIAKAATEAEYGALVVALVPARTDTRWFHDHIWDRVAHAPRPQVEVRFHKGRLTFGGTGTPNSAPFPSMIVVFHPREVRDPADDEYFRSGTRYPGQ
jgi:site-specific DNA-methyltransferase (adenine-specific)